MLPFTTIVGVDDAHAAELKLVWPTWRRHRPEILRQPLLLMCDAVRDAKYWKNALRFVDHPDKRIELWDQPHVEQREKMLSSLVFGTRHVDTPWYLKLDTDAAAVAPGAWLDSRWFNPDAAGHSPVFVSSPWSYTKPADTIDRLDTWGAGRPELQSFPPLALHQNPGWSRVVHPRIISWVFFGATEWTGNMAAICDGRLPVPSQDTFLWYCAARRGDFFRTVRMTRYGWRHIGCRRRLQAACEAALSVPANEQALPSSHAATPAPTGTAEKTSPPNSKRAPTKISTPEFVSPRSYRAAEPATAPDTAPNETTIPTKPTRPRKYPRHVRSLIALLSQTGEERLRGAEVGVALGETSRALLERFPNLELYMVDSWSTYEDADPYYLSGDLCARLTAEQQRERAREAARNTKFAEARRTIVVQDSVAGVELTGEEPLDFAFLDADHTYEGVKRDLEAWWPRIRPGGLLTGHDYGGLRNRLGLFGVSRAVDEFARQRGLSVEKSPGLVWSIRRPADPTPSRAIVPTVRTLDTTNQAAASNRGVVYLLTGAAHADRLIVSLWSLRKHYHGPVTVYTTQPESHEIGRLCAADPRLDIEHRTARQFPLRKNSTFLTKLEILPHVPYDTALYLDADTLVVGDPTAMFELDAERPFGVTQFSNWITSGRIMRRRVEAWRKLRLRRRHRAFVDALVSEAVQGHPAINTGVVSFRKGAEILKPWFDVSLIGWRSFICEEIAMQLLTPRYAHRLFDCRFNCSPIHATNTSDVRIWHFHGDKHLRREQGRKLWLPVYQECLREHVARIDDWTRTEPQLAALAATGR